MRINPTKAEVIELITDTVHLRCAPTTFKVERSSWDPDRKARIIVTECPPVMLKRITTAFDVARVGPGGVCIDVDLDGAS